MSHQGRGRLFALFTACLAGVFAVVALQPAEAQRKSIRWATSNTGSYGYKVAASMVKVLEDALGGEYTVTVEWPEKHNIISGQWEGDRLKGRYSDPQKSTLKRRVEAMVARSKRKPFAPVRLPPIEGKRSAAGVEYQYMSLALDAGRAVDQNENVT